MPRLAIEGGKPVRETLLPYGRHWIDDSDVKAVVDVLRSDWLTTGPKVGELEEAFADYVGAKYAVAVSSGTAALHAAAFACGLTSGDEAITTPLTFAATANCVLYQGARPVFADVLPGTLNLDPEQVTKAITSRTKALIPVDYTGEPADFDEFNQIAARHGLTVIEDAAHSLGALYNGKRVGGLTTMTVFSMHPVKHVTTCEGGIVTTEDEKLAHRLRTFRNHAMTSDARERHNAGNWAYDIAALGYNYRLSDLQCALGLSQLSRLDPWLERRRSIAASYNQAFSTLPEIETPHVRAVSDAAWHLYVIRLNLDTLSVDRAEIVKALRAENINANVHYIPVPWFTLYQELGYAKGQWPVAESAYQRLISLPMFPGMTDADVEDVITAVKKVTEAYRA